jgi:hypothetical protein
VIGSVVVCCAYKVFGSEIAELQFGEDLSMAIARARVPTDFMSCLSREQLAALERHNTEVASRQQERINAEIQSFLADEPTAQRNVMPFLRIKVADCPGFAGGAAAHKIGRAIITFWRASDDMSASLVEGKRVRIFGLTPSSHGSREFRQTSTGQEAEASMLDVENEIEASFIVNNNTDKRRVIHLNAIKSTRLQELGTLPPHAQTPNPIYVPRQVTPVAQLRDPSVVRFHEHFDCCAVFLVECAPLPLPAYGTRAASHIRRIFTIDNSSNTLLVVEVRDNIATKLPTNLRPYSVIAFADLSLSRYDATLDLSVAYATDYTFVGTNPMSFPRSGWNVSFLVRAFTAIENWKKTYVECRVAM